MPDSAATGSAAQTLRVEGDGAAVTQGAKRTLRIRKDGPGPGATDEEGTIARTSTPLTATAPKKAVTVQRTDTVFNTFCVLNILIIGGSIGILTWQCIKHLWS